jgi:hypothetical protein
MKTYEVYSPDFPKLPRERIEAPLSFNARVGYAKKYGINVVEVVAIVSPDQPERPKGRIEQDVPLYVEIKRLGDLAAVYAEDGAYFTAADILDELAKAAREIANLRRDMIDELTGGRPGRAEE